MVSNFEFEELRGNIGIMVNAAGTIDFIKFTIQKGRYFNCKFGRFQVNMRRKYRDGKTNFHVYDTRMGNPLDILALQRINEYIDKLDGADYKITKQDLTDETTQKFLGQHTMHFLDTFSYADKATIFQAMLGAVRGEKPVKDSGNAFVFPAVLRGNFGLFFIDNKFLKLESVKIIKENGKIYAENPKYGRFDVTRKEWRYNWGKANLFFFAVSTIDMPEQTRKFFRFKAVKEDAGPIDADLPEKERKDIPRTKYQAINVSAYEYMEEFSPYEPILVYEKIKHTHHQKQIYDMATKAPQKKVMNVMLIMVAVVSFVVIYQTIINPQISKIQTQMEVDRQQQRQQQQAQQSQTQSPPDGGSEVVGNNPIPRFLLLPYPPYLTYLYHSIT